MRALEMGHWSCRIARQQLVLSAEAAAIMGMADAAPTCLDELLPHFAVESAELLREAFATCARAGTPIDAEVQLAMPRARPRWVRFVGESFPGTLDETGEIHGAVQDISAYKRVREETWRLTLFDTLTGLPNRQLLMERLEDTLGDCALSGQEGALMFIDLDNFKVLNDTMGHSHGDLLLQRVAERLVRDLSKTDIVARIGGDEFMVLLRDLDATPAAAEAKAHAAAAHLLESIAEPFDLDDYLHYGTASIGVARFGTGSEATSELLMQADLAMYQAKDMGGNAVAFFHPAMQTAVAASAALGADLRTALQADGQLFVHYQAQCDRARRITGVEALLRWQHPARGQVSPTEFIPVAENTGLILPLGQWVLEQACAQLAAWACQPGMEDLSIAVNVSARQFGHPEFVNQVMATVARHQVQPHLLRLELTESMLIGRLDVTLARMNILEQFGVSFSLDDFGTGYSSLAYLKRLPLDQLKIDKSFVADLLTNPRDAAIVRTVIGLAHSLNLRVVAEGVETEAQQAFLMDAGCDLFQGYLLAKPALAQEVATFVSRGEAPSHHKAAARPSTAF
ncbi:putative bifunctional diguanylate cyclase/phosphodiesterase [Ottowia sp. VDI28]|uniref:putative bifunctional diguanylate cyclase/phosphodiesterase n=1 Tax=Ottowia sp. VDI28 TaxID=3133968 RepID=UPI003C300DE4